MKDLKNLKQYKINKIIARTGSLSIFYRGFAAGYENQENMINEIEEYLRYVKTHSQ